MALGALTGGIGMGLGSGLMGGLGGNLFGSAGIGGQNATANGLLYGRNAPYFIGQGGGYGF